MELEILPYYALKPFDGWYDAGLNLAKFLVKIWVTSQHFMLENYDGKDEFYDIIIDSTNRFVSELQSISADYDDKIKNIMDYLSINIKNSTLTFERSYYILFILLEWIDNASGKKINIDDYYPRLIDKYRLIGNVEYKEITLAPFLTHTGLFGINTYLYMYYHGIIVSSCTLQTYSAHEGSYNTGHQMMYHDYQHTEGVLRLRPNNVILLKNIYRNIIADQRTTDDEKKVMIFALYMGLHEISYSANVFTKNNPYYIRQIRAQIEFQNDYLPLVKKLDYYESEYKYDDKPVSAAIIHGVDLYSKLYS